MKNKMKTTLPLLGLFISMMSPLLLAEEDRATIMVFDASGSMWGQLKDSRTKIDVAKEVIGRYLKDRDQSTPLGIIAYGHNRKGDCSDIEVIASVGKQDSSALASRINKIKPKGKTPLTDALALAVKQIPKTSEEADIILITDGLETCGRDPCALAQEIADEGINIRAHVVGFGLSEKEVNSLSCIPDKTGGKLLRPQTGQELSDALKSVEKQATEPLSLPIHISLVYEAGTARPTSISYSAKNQETGEVIHLGKTEDTAEIVRGFNTELLKGKWLLMANGPQGSGELDITTKSGESYRIPYAAQKAGFSLLNYGPYQLGQSQSFLLELGKSMQRNLTLTAELFPANATSDKERIEHEYLIGVEKGIHEIDFKSPKTAGKYQIIIGKGFKEQVASFDIEYVDNAKPTLRVPDSVKPNEKFAYTLTGNWYRNNTLLIIKNGKKISDKWLQYTIEKDGIYLTAPAKEGRYGISLRYTDSSGKNVTEQLATLNVGDVKENKPIEESSSSSTEEEKTKTVNDDNNPVGGEGLSADEHGWEPNSEDSTADKALLLSPKAGSFVKLCRDTQCTYDDEKTGFKGITLLGDYGLLEPLTHDDSRPWLTIVNEYNGEWVQVNPPQETDMTMSCVRVGTKGYHEQDSDTATDSICVVKGANGYTMQMMETIAMWVVEHNIALASSDKKPNDSDTQTPAENGANKRTSFGKPMSTEDIANFRKKIGLEK